MSLIDSHDIWLNHDIAQIVPVVGGLALPKQARLLSYKPEIVVGTPGRLWEVISGGHAHFKQLGTLKFLVIDEADRMVCHS